MSNEDTVFKAELQNMIKIIARTVYEVTKRCDPSGSFTEDFDEVLAETLSVLGKKGGEVLDPRGVTSQIAKRLERGETLTNIAESVDQDYMAKHMLLSSVYVVGIEALTELKREVAK